MGRLSKTLSGVSGEYFVAAELSRRGYIASITLRNSRGIDLLCAAEDGDRAVRIQVKTNQGSRPEWMLSGKADTHVDDDLFYVFVSLHGLEGSPTYHVVESEIVANHCRSAHAEWLSQPKADGTPRKNTSMRIFADPDGVYLGAWERLGL
jgi:hypothetical protein